MKTKTIKKEAVVLLIAALMAFSSVTVLANTNTPVSINQNPAPTHRDLIWDNVLGVAGSRGGIIVATVRTEGIAFPADDFQLDTTKEATSVAWQGGYFQCQLAQGQKDYHWDWRILFWNDIGNGSWPGTVIYNQTISDASITRSFWYNFTRIDNGNTYWVANYSCELPVPITFNGGTKYWITIDAIQTPNTYPQGCWARHNSSQSAIKLHESMFKGVYWGYPNWVTIMALLVAGGDPNPLPHDLNFQLFGGAPQDTTPPVTTATFSGTNPVTVTISATDDMSGVNHTYYNLDAAGYVEYTAPFDVTISGNHTIFVYSTDKAGNSETPHSYTFTVAPPPIGITIKKGLGITATIKNTGTATLTNISWNIQLTGGLIILGKTKSEIIASLAPAASAKAKDFVLGFGKTNIVVTAGTASANATGTVLLILVI